MGAGASTHPQNAREKYLVDELAKLRIERDELAALAGKEKKYQGEALTKIEHPELGNGGADLQAETSVKTIESLLGQVGGAKSSWERPDAPQGDAFWAEALAPFESEYPGEMGFTEWEVMVVLGGVGHGWLESRLGASRSLARARALRTTAWWAPLHVGVGPARASRRVLSWCGRAVSAQVTRWATCPRRG
jgi:hypothetical protein